MKPTGAALTAGVIGQPIAHSLSPLMMSAWIEAADINAIHTPYIATPHMFTPVVSALFRAGLKGLNVTLPHKTEALMIANRISDAADRIGAANLLTYVDGEIHADNTDAFGFISSLRKAGVEPEGKSVLVLGAGGASRAVTYGLLDAGARDIAIANRSLGKARDIARDLAPNAEILSWDDRSRLLGEVDIVVNATSLGLKGQIPLEMDWSGARDGLIAVDTVYTPLETQFLADARGRGLQGVDGLGMLIEQGKPSFQAFFGCAAPEQADIRSLLQQALEPAE